MNKQMQLFRGPTEPFEVDRQWSRVFIRLAEKLPGIKREAVSRIYAAPSEEVECYLLHEFFFENREALRAAMLSLEDQATGKALISFAGDLVTIIFAEHFEEGRMGMNERDDKRQEKRIE